MPIRLPRIPHPTLGPAHIVLAVAVLLLGLFIYAAVQTAQNTFVLNERQTLAQAEVYELRRQKAELEGLREYLTSDEYIEAVAREQFGLVRPGETAVIVEAPESTEPVREPGESWWEALFGR